MKHRGFWQMSAGLLLALGAVPGCGSSDASSGPKADSSQAPVSDMCKGATEYTAGLVAMGDKGLIKVTLLDSIPSPPGVGNNDWTIDVQSADGTEMAGAKVSFVIYMPIHGHNGARNPVISDNGDGTYLAKYVNFNMDGVWEVTVTATSADGTVEDSAMFRLCAL